MKRLIMLMLVTALLALLAASGAAMAAVTAQGFSNPSSIQIPDYGQASTYPSEIHVSGFPQGSRVKDVNLTLHGFSHGFTADVDAMLVSPGGKRNAVVLSDTGTGANDVTIRLDDEALNTLPSAHKLASGAFKPKNVNQGADAFPFPAPAPSGEHALSAFDGTNPNGTWKLYVVDDTSLAAGQFSGGWSLRIRAE
jgi:subtilisin-like proprotein convertase family protein